MFGLFSGNRTIVDEDQEAWIREQSDWLDTHVGFPAEPMPLITPTEAFFSRPPETGHARALHVFQDIKRLMDVADWPCDLEPQEDDIDPHLDELMLVQNAPQAPLGTFRVTASDAPRIVITYSPRSLGDMQSLIATLAHELSHYLLAACTAPRLGTEEEEEPLTDLLAIKSGFGLFLANSSFTFSQYSGTGSQGWRTSAQGYLTERETVFALMLFLHQNGHDLNVAEPYLKPHLYKLLRKADRASGSR